MVNVLVNNIYYAHHISYDISLLDCTYFTLHWCAFGFHLGCRFSLVFWLSMRTFIINFPFTRPLCLKTLFPHTQRVCERILFYTVHYVFTLHTHFRKRITRAQSYAHILIATHTYTCHRLCTPPSSIQRNEAPDSYDVDAATLPTITQTARIGSMVADGGTETFAHASMCRCCSPKAVGTVCCGCCCCDVDANGARALGTSCLHIVHIVCQRRIFDW